MAENDIYNSKEKYKRYSDLSFVLHKQKGNTAKYYCKNPINLKYFKAFKRILDSNDLSFVRRLGHLQKLKVLSYLTKKDLKDLDRDDINSIMIKINEIYNPNNRRYYISFLKYFFRNILPEKDEKGRIDESITPFVVRHLKGKVDKSREKRKEDRLSPQEYKKIVDYFEMDKRVQFFITFSTESLGRPQEILYLKMKDVEIFDNYAKIYISEKGKTGTGLLQCIDSFPYLVKWLKNHPFKDDPESFLFINTGKTNFGKQLHNININKHLRTACKRLGINKRITCYSFKRNGVTFKRLQGYSDVEIQHTARWTTTNQIQTYDKSNQEDIFKQQLAKRGLIKDTKYKAYFPETKICSYCDKTNGFSEEFCVNCKRPMDRDKVKELIQKGESKELKDLINIVEILQKKMNKIENIKGVKAQ